jgi:hypothetical protein
MSAIQTIIDTYVRFADEQGLLALKAHRLKLLAAIDENDPFFRTLRNQCIEEISAIEAGLVRLRPPAVPPEVGVPEAVALDADYLPDADHPPMEAAVTEPVAGRDEDNAVAAAVNDVAASDQDVNVAAPPPVSDSLKPCPADTFDPSLIAASLLAASLATRTEIDGPNLATELVKLQLRLATRLKG